MGKVPKGRTDETDRRQREKMRLRRELDQAIKREDYEAAARLRDEIKMVEKA